LFLEPSKTPLALIKTTIGGVYFGVAAFPFSKWTFSEKMQLNICFLVTETWYKKLIESILEDDKSKSQFIRGAIREKIK